MVNEATTMVPMVLAPTHCILGRIFLEFDNNISKERVLFKATKESFVIETAHYGYQGNFYNVIGQE